LKGSRNCIFHIPMYIDPTVSIGSRVRPRAMLSALQEIGYHVDVVWGWAAERQAALKAVKQKMAEGVVYDFLYSESSTMPTLLTEKHHWPTHPWLDFDLFRVCHRANVPVGLFYRDVYWRFEQYRRYVTASRRLLAIFFYHLDLIAYRRWVDALFLPNLRMLEHVRLWPRQKPVHALPPGAEVVDLRLPPVADKLRLLYVGSVVPPLYNIATLLQAVAESIETGARVDLTICCPREQWDQRPSEYERWQGGWLRVVHLSGQELRRLYETHHIAMSNWVPSPYLDFSMPIKLFEAVGFGRPVIVPDNTAAADFVVSEGCGWAVGCTPDRLVALLRRLSAYPDEVVQKAAVTCAVRQHHTWGSRAQEVARLLGHMNKESRIS